MFCWNVAAFFRARLKVNFEKTKSELPNSVKRVLNLAECLLIQFSLQLSCLAHCDSISPSVRFRASIVWFTRRSGCAAAALATCLAKSCRNAGGILTKFAQFLRSPKTYRPSTRGCAAKQICMRRTCVLSASNCAQPAAAVCDHCETVVGWDGDSARQFRPSCLLTPSTTLLHNCCFVVTATTKSCCRIRQNLSKCIENNA